MDREKIRGHGLDYVMCCFVLLLKQNNVKCNIANQNWLPTRQLTFTEGIASPPYLNIFKSCLVYITHITANLTMLIMSSSKASVNFAYSTTDLRTVITRRVGTIGNSLK